MGNKFEYRVTSESSIFLLKEKAKITSIHSNWKEINDGESKSC